MHNTKRNRWLSHLRKLLQKCLEFFRIVRNYKLHSQSSQRTDSRDVRPGSWKHWQIHVVFFFHTENCCVASDNESLEQESWPWDMKITLNAGRGRSVSWTQHMILSDGGEFLTINCSVTLDKSWNHGAPFFDPLLLSPSCCESQRIFRLLHALWIHYPSFSSVPPRMSLWFRHHM